MLNSGSCEGTSAVLGGLDAAGRVEPPIRLPVAPGEVAGPEPLKEAARDFASLLYSALVKQMQATVREEEDEDGPIRQCATDFMGMFLPRALAGSDSDGLARHVHEQLSSRYGENVHDGP